MRRRCEKRTGPSSTNEGNRETSKINSGRTKENIDATVRSLRKRKKGNRKA